MIKAKVVSITYSESVGGIPKLDLETYLEDPVVPELFCGADFWDGLGIVIMTKEDYEDMDSARTVIYKSLLDEKEKTEKLRGENDKLKRENNEKEGEICKLIVANKDLEEKLAQEAAEVYLCPDGTLVFKKKKVSELEKKVKKLEDENKYLKKG